MKLECDVIAPLGEHRATIVWLHGIGQDTTVFADLAQRLGLSKTGIRSVFPRAAEQLVTMSTGRSVCAWFDQKVWSMDDVDLVGLNASEQHLRKLVAGESKTIGANRVFLAGFSQGAAMALIVGLLYPESLGGIMLYAPYMVKGTNLLARRSPSSVSVPIWIGHGRRDAIIPARLGGWVRNVLRKWGYKVSWNMYAGGHEPFDGAGKDLRQFLDDVLVSSCPEGAAMNDAG